MKKIFSFILTVFISALTIAQETMTFQAEIANKNSNTLSINSGRETIQKIEADEKGNFKATFAIKEGLYQLFDGAEYANLYFKNGYNLKMTMDATKFDETISFSGNGAEENNFLAQRTLQENSIDFQTMLELDADGFNKASEAFKASQLASLEASKIDVNLKDMLKKGTEANIGQLQQYYTMSQAKKKMNNVAAPNFDFENHKGGKTTLESLKGKYVYVDLWATWCGPCRAEIPSLKKMEADFHGKNIEFVSVSIDAEKDYEKWKTFVVEKELTGTQLYAAKANQTEFVKAFEVNSIPRFILIDPKGVVVDADAKRPSDPRLREQLNKLLN
jgi:thiol-disulfide isomerase/thioredoxin